MTKIKDLRYLIQEQNFLNEIEAIADNPPAVESFINENYNNFLKDLPDGEYKQKLLKRIYKESLKKNPEDGHRPVSITRDEIRFLQALPDEFIKRAFYSLIIRQKVRSHPSGWVSLDFENTMSYAFEDKEIRKMKIEMLAQCSEYGFETRVSGSNKPVLCFRVPKFDDEIVVFEFEDGGAREKYLEVIRYDPD